MAFTIAALLASLPAEAQPASREDDAEAEKVVTRVYDIRDLIVVAPDYPFRGSMIPARQVDVPPVAAQAGLYGRLQPTTAPAGAGSAAAASAADERSRTKQEMIDEIVRLMTETVAPDSWRDAGGSVGAVRELQGQLIVNQTQENHRQVVALLAQLRQTQAKMVRVQAQWILLPPAEADKLLGRGVAEGGRREALQRVDAAALAELPDGAARFRGETVGFNTQTVHVISGPTRTMVADVDAQVGTGTAAFDPVVEVARGGLMLQVKPTLSSDGASAVIDLHSAFVSPNPDGPGIRPRASTAGEEGKPGAPPLEMTVDRFDATVQELRTTVVVPIGRPVLIGGMTLSPDSAKPDAPQLYLVIEVLASEFGGEGVTE